MAKNSSCPMCGTFGKMWNKAPEVFLCPNCSSLYSEFGLVLEPENLSIDFCS
ncbi:MAG: hypothetical protein HYX24_06630 [Candidatus Aenigmarchaeota archaeon]|nr:hypothetical protein [Candidatus Aenigmarchaeota archaeon]